MAKLTAKQRNDLLDMKKRQLADERCKICKELHVEGKKLTESLDEQIKDLDIKRAKLSEEREKILNDAKLAKFQTRYGECTTDILHPRLIAFDKEADRIIEEIIRS